MSSDDGLFVMLFCGVGLSILYFWSAIKQRARRLMTSEREIAQFLKAQAKQQRTSSGAAPSKAVHDLEH